MLNICDGFDYSTLNSGDLDDAWRQLNALDTTGLGLVGFDNGLPPLPLTDHDSEISMPTSFHMLSPTSFSSPLESTTESISSSHPALPCGPLALTAPDPPYNLASEQETGVQAPAQHELRRTSRVRPSAPFNRRELDNAIGDSSRGGYSRKEGDALVLQTDGSRCSNKRATGDTNKASKK